MDWKFVKRNSWKLSQSEKQWVRKSNDDNQKNIIMYKLLITNKYNIHTPILHILQCKINK